MQKLNNSLIHVALFLVLFSGQVIAGGSSQTVESLVGKDAESQGISHGKDFTVQGGTSPQILAPVVISAEEIAKKKKATPEEIAAYRVLVEEARSRDDDRFVQTFIDD